MADRQDLYETLGVDRDADRDTIRKAYRKLARQHHPDVNPGDRAAEERFKQISFAWQVLQDDEKRRNYDEFGEVSLEAGFDPEKARQAREAFGERFGFGGRPGAAPGGEEFHFGDLDDLLGRMFGGDAREGAGGLRLRGPDLEARLEVGFLEAVRGGERSLSLARPGPGGEAVPETLKVKIPPGVDDGTRLRLAGKGGPGMGGGPSGDLYVELRVAPHRVFRREGRDLLLDLPVTVREATLGARVEVPTLDGRATLSIPPGTDSGARLRMRGKGVPGAKGAPAGDMLVRVEIRVPRGLDEEAKQALAGLERYEDPAIRKDLFG